MGHYTTSLKNLIESDVNLGLSDYPIFESSYRATLNKKITDHFMFREIGFETPALFVWFLNVKMREIMPYYNQLYLSALLTFDPLATTKMTETSKKESAGTASSLGASTSEMANSNKTNNKNVHSETPSGLLAIGNIEGDVYASDADINETQADNTADSISTAENNSVANAIDDFVKTVEGRNGNKTPSELIKEFRGTFLNIDMQIVKDLEGLFMMVW